MYTQEWARGQVPAAVPPAQTAMPPAALGGKAVLAPPAPPAAMAVPQAGATRPIFDALQVAMGALQLTCAITSELRVLPETRALSGLSELHGQVLTPLSYHLTTALGAARLIAAGHNRRPMWLLLLGCMMAAERNARALPDALGRVQSAAGPPYAGLMRAAQDWGARTSQALQRALLTAQAAIGPALWNDLAREAAQI